MQRVVEVGAISIALVVACARPQVPQPGQLATADAALLRGCYDCLIEARDIYRRLDTGGDRAQLAARVLEADLLLALRERELGLPPSDALAEARQIATTMPPDLEAGRYIELVAAIPPSDLGVARRELWAFRNAHPLDDDRLAELRRLLSNGRLRKPVRDYLQLALDCGHFIGVPLGPGEAPVAPPSGALLLRYRAAICGAGEMPELVAVRAGEPRFVEASLFIARVEIAQILSDGPREAKAHLDEVLARFPSSPAATYLAGTYHTAVSDHAEALRFYDRTLGLHADHDPALRGRVISLSNLERAEEAIDAATQLIARAEDERFGAYYWRARNHHGLRHLDDARRDVTAAKELGASEDLLVLAGLVEYEQGDLDIAHADLTTVAGAHGLRCEANWYLGLIERLRKRWPDAWQAFEEAMRCYGERARITAGQIRTLEARSDLDPGYRARTAAYLEASVASDTKQGHVASLTAAGSAAAAADYAAARRLIDQVGDDPELADRVAKLRAWLDRSHSTPP